MTFETEFLELFSSTVTWNARTGVDSYGNPTYGSNTSVQCRIDDLSSGFGESVDSAREQSSPASSHTTATIIAQVASFSEGDKITLPTGDVVYITDVDTEYDETGAHHVVITTDSGEKR